MTWEYYNEFSPPDAIDDADLDKLSFFRSTVLFPSGMFLEHANGQKPIDIDDESAVYAGFRFGM